jgi:hypothetical protein
VQTFRARITGTVTITSFGSQPNAIRFVRFAGALTLTHNATTLILQGGANRITAADDVGLYITDASGNWREMFYHSAATNLVTSSATGVALTNATNANVTTISVPPGDWVVTGTLQFTPTAATITALQTGAGTVSATLPAIALAGKNQLSSSAIDGAAATFLPTPTYNLTLLVTTTIYLVGTANFSAGSISASGYLAARRVR